MTVIWRSAGVRFSSGGSDVSSTKLPGAVLTPATAAAASRAVPHAAVQAPRTAPAKDESSAQLLQAAPQ